MAEKKIMMAIKKAKMNMKGNQPCDSLVEYEDKLHISINEAVNGYSIRLRGEEFLAETPKKALEIIKEML